MLVQRNGWGKQKPIQNVTQLIGKKIHVKPGRYLDRLHNLNKELGGGIDIEVVDNDSLSAEDLISMVAKGEIDFTVCDNTFAKLNKTYFYNLNIDLAISFDQRSSWAVRKTSPFLAEAATRWYWENVKTSSYKQSHKRYFEISKQIQQEICQGNPLGLAIAGLTCLYRIQFRHHSCLMGRCQRTDATYASYRKSDGCS